MKSLSVAVLVMGLLLTNSTVSAAVIRPGLHASAGFVFPQEDALESSFVTGFGLIFPITGQISLNFNFLSWKGTVRDMAGERLQNGDLRLTPFMLSLDYAFLKQGKVIPFIGGGFGYVFSQYKMGSVVTVPEITLTQKVNNGFNFHGVVGIKFKLIQNVTLHTQAMYFFRKAKGVTTIRDINTGMTEESFSLDLHAVLIQAGFVMRI